MVLARKRVYRKRVVGRKLSKRQVSTVKRLITNKQEIKYYAFNLGATNVDFTGFAQDLLQVPQGVTDQDRDGDRLTIKWLTFRYQFSVASAGTLNNVRLILFQWKPNNAPSVTSILLGSTGSALASLLQYNHDQKQNYKILYDRFMTLDTYHPTAHGTVKIPSYKLNKSAQFISGGTSGTNHVYALCISDDGVTTYPTVTFTVKLDYTDG